MTNLHPDHHNNFVDFIRDNQPHPPQAGADLEDTIVDSLESRTLKKRQYITSWTIPHARAITKRVPTKLLATGMLFTTVSFSVKTSRMAIEPQDMEKFLVNSWQDTLNENQIVATEENEVYWLLPTVTESSPALSVVVP